MSQSSCHFCGSPLASNDKACQFCGQPVPGPSSPAPEVPDSYIAPPEPYETPIPTAPASDMPPKTSQADQFAGPVSSAPKSASPIRWIVIAVIILLVLCCCAIAVVWAFFGEMDFNLGLQIYRPVAVELLTLVV